MKKKLVILIIGIVMVCFSFGAFAEPIDLSKYSNDDLLKLLYQIQSEIVDRSIEKTALLEPGSYIGGVDIPVGSYLILGANPEDEGIIDLRYPMNEQKMQPLKLQDVWQPGDTIPQHITIEERDKLTITLACYLTITPGVVFQ